jgi:hypothetical protein
MAFGSSNPDQIMETQTKFNLSDHLAQWRAACAQTASIRPENLAELETHLHDSMAALRRQGLSEEEAFLIGARRLGSPSKLAPEYGKVNASEIWFSRLAWMFAGTLLMSAVQTTFQVVSQGSAVLWTKLGNQPLSFNRFYGWDTGWLNQTVGLLLMVLPLTGWFWAARWLLANHSTFDFKPTKPLRLFLAFGALSSMVSLASLWATYGLATWGNIQGSWANHQGVSWTIAAPHAIHIAAKGFAIPLCFYFAWRCVIKRHETLQRV